MTSLAPFQDTNLRVLRIADFSPGIVQYGRGSQPVVYTTNAPPGSAAFAARCIVRPGVGLVPFPTYSQAVLSNAPADTPTGPVTITGFLATGPVSNSSGGSLALPPQLQELADVLYIAIDYHTSGTHQHAVQQLNLPTTTNTTLYDSAWSLTGEPSTTLTGISFTATYVAFGTLPTTSPLGPVIVWTDSISGANVWTSPNWTSGGGYTDLGSLDIDSLIPIVAVFAHESRIMLLTPLLLPYSGAGFQPYANEYLIPSDPPESLIFTGVNSALEVFDIEDASGYGAWGSISSGELCLIRAGMGAVIINGDMVAPSSAIKLPGVVGTGRVMQRATNSPIGLIYVTEYNGVWTWNGGNTSQKISNNIPDDALNRAELEGVTVGVTHIHDCLDNLVFFPNNWVFDCLTNSWWKCEDPAVLNFAVFTRSRMNSRIMYAAAGQVSSSPYKFSIKVFDMLAPASSWEWISNPIPVANGELVDLHYCEIVASNMTASPCSITVTPTTSPGATAISAANNPNTLTFTIPAMSSGARLSQPLGYTDYNIQFEIVATNNNNTLAAPTLHEIAIGWATSTLTAAA